LCPANSRQFSVDDDTEDKQTDEWFRVGRILSEDPDLLAAPTALGRVLREAAIILADPDVSREKVDALRRLTDEFNRMADRHGNREGRPD
jgi:hypothetical protein